MPLSRFKRLKQVVEDNTTQSGKIFDYSVQILILISIVSLTLETLPNLEPETYKLLYAIDLFCISLFTIEYLLRVLVAENKIKYVTSFYGVIDLLAILPFILPTKVDLRILRSFRVLRVFRAQHLTRYSRALTKFRIAFGLIKEEIVLFLIITFILIYISATGIYYFEHAAQPELFSSIFHSLWWAVVTLTTVGYGDIYPITTGGRVFTFFMLTIGVGVVTVPAGLVATSLIKAGRIMEAREKSEDEN